LASPATLPRATSSANLVQAVPEAVSGPASSELPQEPSNLTADIKSFLTKYQPYANTASDLIGPKQADKFSATGLCFAETPCFTVNGVSIASIPAASGQSLPALSIAQISTILDSILATPNTTFDDSDHSTVFSGLKMVSNGAVLEVIAPKGAVPSSLVAGMVLDTYKASVNSGTNAVRALEAQGNSAAPVSVALCLYPSNADATASQNFCVGKELDGSVVPSTLGKRFDKRFSLFGDFCSIIDIPILC